MARKFMLCKFRKGRSFRCKFKGTKGTLREPLREPQKSSDFKGRGHIYKRVPLVPLYHIYTTHTTLTLDHRYRVKGGGVKVYIYISNFKGLREPLPLKPCGSKESAVPLNAKIQGSGVGNPLIFREPLQAWR